MEDESVEIILFEQIQLALAVLLTTKVIRSVEIWNAQIDNGATERPRKYPYVAIQIDTAWQNEEAVNSVPNLLQNQQKGTCNIIIHYIYESLKNETNAWIENRAIVHSIHRAVNGLEYDDFITPLIRTNTPHEDSHGRVSDIQINYNTQLIECGIIDDTQTEIEMGNFDIQFNNKLSIDNVIIRSGILTSIGRVFHVNDFPPADYVPQQNDVIVR